jgi:hypothetical protein
MTAKCSITLTYDTYPKPLPLGTTKDPEMIVLLKRKLIEEAAEALHGAEAVGDAVLIATFRNDLDTLRRTLDLLVPPEMEELYLRENERGSTN